MNAEQIIEKLNLKPLPEEGGYYAETFRDPDVIVGTELPHLGGKHNYSILYLLSDHARGILKPSCPEVF